MTEEGESKGSRSSSTQSTIENFRKLKEDICDDVDRLIFGFPQYRGLKPESFILGIVFEDGRIHTIYPKELALAESMLQRMTAEVEKVKAVRGFKK